MLDLTKKQIKTIKEIEEHYKLLIKKSIVNRKLAKEFIDIARNDLKTAKALQKTKDRELNASMVYHIQQSVEKYSKAYALIFGAVSKRSMKEIGHEPSKAFIKCLRNKDMNKVVSKLRSIQHLVYEKDSPATEVLKINYII